jgi:uncharacterized membrane protein YccC
LIGRATHTLRSAATLAAGRPAYAAGIRASVATIVPLALGHVLGNPIAGTWMSLGGFNGALSDRGGSYESRARTMILLTVGGAITATVGAVVAGHFIAALVATFVIAYAASVVRVWGAPGVSIGGAVLSVYVVSLGIGHIPGSPDYARAGFIVLGGLWAMIIALVLWPLKPYRPARVAVSNVYRALAAYTRDVSEAASERHTAEWAVQAIAPQITNVRGALESARAVLVQLRRGRPGSAERGERLLILGELADQLFGHVVAASEMLSAIPRAPDGDLLHERAVGTLQQIVFTANELADGIVDEGENPEIEVAWSGDALRAAVSEHPEADSQYEYIATILDRAAQFASAASVSLEALNGRRASRARQLPLVRSISAEDIETGQSLLEMFRATLSPDSLIVRFALRVAIVTTAAVALTEWLGITRGYWLTLTVIVILQPYTGVTLTRAVQRVAGTVLGGLVAIALGSLFHDAIAILVIAAVFVACCVALLPLNYAAFSVFLTPTFVLLAEASAGEWNLAQTRVLNTLMGGALALLGARVLWPSPESARFPAHAAATLRAVQEYLAQAVRHFGDRSPTASDILRAARRKVGLATVNTEESLQRALVEAHGDETTLAPALTLLAYIRRLTASIAALSIVRHAGEVGDTGSLDAFQRIANETLADLADALEQDALPASLPVFRPTEAISDSPLLRARIERLVRQIATLHDTVHRMNQPAASVPVRRVVIR